MSPLMGNRSQADEKDQRQSRGTRKNRLPLQSLHLQELQLLNDGGRTSQVVRPPLLRSRPPHSGLTGLAANSPTTVVHSRTCQRLTRPFTT